MKNTKRNVIFSLFVIVSFIFCNLFNGMTSVANTQNGISFICGQNASTAHVQSYGDTAGTVSYIDGIMTLNLGTTGQGKRLESVCIKMNNNTGYSGSIAYRVHVQSYGWLGWANNGEKAGTSGKAKRLEGIEIKLTGELAEHYDVRYRVHIQTYGDSQGWVYNGALAGTTGEAKRLERLQVQIIPKSVVTGEPSVSYRVHRQTYGWEQFGKKDGQVSGTTGQGKRLEGIEIFLSGGNKYSGSICYQTHVQTYGWETEWKKDGQMSGTSGQAKRLEAIRIYLTGEIADYYDVYYRVHAQSYGWLSWACNGQMAGTAGQAKRLEAIQIVLVKKGNPVPGVTYSGVTAGSDSCYISSKNESNLPIIPPGNKDEGGGTDDGDTGGGSPDTGGGTENTSCKHTHTVDVVTKEAYTKKFYTVDNYDKYVGTARSVANMYKVQNASTSCFWYLYDLVEYTDEVTTICADCGKTIKVDPQTNTSWKETHPGECLHIYSYIPYYDSTGKVISGSNDSAGMPTIQCHLVCIHCGEDKGGVTEVSANSIYGTLDIVQNHFALLLFQYSPDFGTKFGTTITMPGNVPYYNYDLTNGYIGR